jgi:hypothetical protein
MCPRSDLTSLDKFKRFFERFEVFWLVMFVLTMFVLIMGLEVGVVGL